METQAPLNGEQLIALSEACGLFPRKQRKGGGQQKLNISTLWRWISQGIHGIRLDAVRVGYHWFTSREAVARFMVASNAPRRRTPPPTPAELGLKHRRRSAAESQAIRELVKMGLPVGP